MTRESKLLITIISEYTALTPGGEDRLIADCPFHEANHRTLNVTPSRGLWWCYECRGGGDVVTFAARAESLTTEQAVEWLRGREQRML
jgi:DNA primase